MVPGGGSTLIGPNAWAVVRRDGDAARLHRFEPPDDHSPTLVLAVVSRPALVLGSGQGDGLVDHERAVAAGLEVVRRRSGGGSVLLIPDEHVWVDVWIPSGSGLWNDDVVATAIPVGEAWARVLAGLGSNGAVHGGGADRGRLESLVCFAGRGPGEVFDGHGRKLVGVSQRRTRDWIRLQTLVHRRWDPVRTLAGLALTEEERRDALQVISTRVATVALDGSTAVAALADALSAPA